LAQDGSRVLATAGDHRCEPWLLIWPDPCERDLSFEMIDYEEDWIASLIFRRDGSVAIRATYYALPSAVIGVLLLVLDDWEPTAGFRQDVGLMDLDHTQIWSATTFIVVLLLGFRTRQGLSRFWEGTTLLHQMRGEWFDTVSNCVTFSISAKRSKPSEVMNFRHALVRLMSLAHGSALEEIAGNQVKIGTIDIRGLDRQTLVHVQECHEIYRFNKVEMMLHLIQSLITAAHDEGLLKIPPPILSRVYQTISRGFVNLLNAKKICDTRFPFPYAQLITMLLLALVVLTPMILSTMITSKVMVFIFTFIPMFGMFSLNFIAIELENPFGLDDNDLPLDKFQEEMNSCLLMLLHPNTDLITSCSSQCVMPFDKLMQAVLTQGMASRLSNASVRRSWASVAGAADGQEDAGYSLDPGMTTTPTAPNGEGGLDSSVEEPGWERALPVM